MVQQGFPAIRMKLMSRLRDYLSLRQCESDMARIFEILQYGLWTKNRGENTQNGMVKIMENPINPWMIWGENPTIFGNIHILQKSLEYVRVVIVGFFLDDVFFG